jgi:hypothetical protein
VESSEPTKEMWSIHKHFSSHHTVAFVDLGMFAIVALLAWQLQWSPTDLVWSLWLSSLLVGYSTILGWVFEIPKGILGAKDHSTGRPLRSNVGRWVAAIVTTLFTLAFFTVHFGGFHFGHSIFLFFFFPQPEFGTGANGIMGNWFGFVGFLILRYWPFVLAAGISTWSSILHHQSKLAPERAYTNVIRIHFMIFVYAGMTALKIHNSLIYILTLFVFFFPWRKGFRGHTTGPEFPVDR